MHFLFSPDVTPPALEPEAIYKRYGEQIEAALNRRLYHGSILPTLLTLVGGLCGVALFRSQHDPQVLVVVLAWLLLLIGLSLWQIVSFLRSPATRQAEPRWRQLFLLGALASGATLSLLGIVFLPQAESPQRALLYGLLTAVTICASVAYAVSLRAFLAFILPSLLPVGLYLLTEGYDRLQAWGIFSLVLLAALLLTGWQINRTERRNLLSTFQQQSLLEFEEQAWHATVRLNDELANEVRQRQRVEEELRAAQLALEERVTERTRALGASERARREEEAKRLYLTSHDPLTGLANRNQLLQRLEELARQPRQRSEELALLHIDLDRFKLINDSLGHRLADEILCELSHRLSSSLRQADTIARVAEDQFSVLLECGCPEELDSLARRLLAVLRHSVQIGEHEVVVSASLGIGLLSVADGDPARLLSQASMAMRHAKQFGGNTVQFWREGLQNSSHERLLLEAQLDKALEQGHLEVFYQPRLGLSENRLQGAEALVRWRHPQLGLVSPAEFIPLAEETGQIRAIGAFVLRRACTQVLAWQQAGLGELCISVNISMQQLRERDFAAQVATVLEETGLPAHQLELELTESQLSDNIEELKELLLQLRGLGVRLAIDDFGTGYSSLAYLKHLPVNVVKIDQTFIRALDGSGKGGDAAIIRAIIAMVHSLGLEVVAEGVEQQAQLEFLRDHGCDEIQGYLISRPVEASAFADLLRSREASPVA
ncbi:putative bifunctional diguanylate cyclase/phosphodiesterase [Azotobacter bryophylli]|uniref:Bifunctional diguanylate cyclase/phosphodiesterase n=1 Tax=Azotobacter bryophylli TaxID=1986537 RepID=A0ABV7AVT5_9GAMM